MIDKVVFTYCPIKWSVIYAEECERCPHMTYVNPSTHWTSKKVCSLKRREKT